MSIEPTNLAAQLHHRAAGNPPSTLPDAAISNCFPGLEFDLRNLWRRILEGIEVHESNGLVTAAADEHAGLVGSLLVRVADVDLVVEVRGPSATQEDARLGSTFVEWSNALAGVLAASSGELVECLFVDTSASPPAETVVALRVRPVFARSSVTDEPLALIDEDLAQPGELTQSLCSPWQNDYRECGCYYWAASRPDYVNRESTGTGQSVGNNWLARSRTPKTYDVPDEDQHSYEELFRDWQGLLRFVVGGEDLD